MNFKTSLICAFLCLSTVAANAYAAASQPNQEEATVVGACMVKRFMEHNPPIEQAKIEKCADAVASAVPKCLGLSEEEYALTIKICIAKLANTKCVAGKMNVPLMKYATCEYEKDTAGCYKELGFTTDQVTKMTKECEKSAG